MKKIIFLTLVFCGFSLYSENVQIEARAAYFYPTDSNFRDIYHSGGIYGIEINVPVTGWIYPWASASVFYKSGRTNLKSKTSVTMIPFGLGVKAKICFWDCLYPYVGFGVLGTYLHAKNHSNFVLKNRDKFGFGGIVKTGAYYEVWDCFFIDIFLDYSFTKFHFHKTNLTIGRSPSTSGISAGGGIGYKF